MKKYLNTKIVAIIQVSIGLKKLSGQTFLRNDILKLFNNDSEFQIIDYTIERFASMKKSLQEEGL